MFFKSASQARIAMSLVSIVLAALILDTSSAAWQQQPPVQKRAAVKTAKAAKKPVPEPPPAPPPPPPTLQQMPAQPPQVKYAQGQLTIVSENSTLADVLRAVRTQTGASVEIPANANERVVAHLGPGPVRDVLTALLNGSHFNYVMVGSESHPDRVEKLILTSKSGGAVPGSAPAPTMTVQPAAQGDNEAQGDDSGSPGTDVAEQAADDPPENPPNEDQQPNGQQQAKTPEQLLRELQQQQQLQQQLQQQQQQPAPGAPPPPPDPNN